jgi:hypothetical protein
MRSLSDSKKDSGQAGMTELGYLLAEVIIIKKGRKLFQLPASTIKNLLA